MENNITVSVPGKLMVLGEHAVVYGYPCIVTAVDKYLTVEGKKIPGKNDKINSYGNKDLSFVKNAIFLIREKYDIGDKFQLDIRSEISGMGLGSSAAVTVGTVKILSVILGLNLSSKEVFDLSYRVVRINQPMSSGFDIASCIYGSTILFDGSTKKVKKITDKILPLIAIFSGKKADTVSMVDQMAHLYKNNPVKTKRIFDSIEKLVKKGVDAIKNENWQILGKLMNENQKYLKELGVSSEILDRIIDNALQSGANGAKISGAGGGDCIIILASEEKKKIITERLLEKNYSVLKI